MLIVNERERNNILDIRILYEDNHLLIVEKPVNVPVQQDRSNDQDLLTTLKQWIKKRDHKPGNVYLSLVHRLDRPVGGAIILAKTSKAASRLADALRKREIERTYIAVVRGKIEKEADTLKHYLWKDRRRNEVRDVGKHVKGAKEAILSYRVLETKENLSLVKIALQTGRSHQIRVQFKAIGHPLYGDQKYGANVNKVGEQIALWSTNVSFIHPVRREPLSIDSLPPNVAPWNKWKSIKK